MAWAIFSAAWTSPRSAGWSRTRHDRVAGGMEHAELVSKNKGIQLVILAVLTALASAAFFAGGSAMQHRTAGNTSNVDENTSGVHLMARLARRPAWVFGLVFSAIAFGLHALALKQGSLSLVQPVIVSGIVFAVFLRAGLEHRLPPRRVMIWSALTWAGLALFIAVLPASAEHPEKTTNALWFVGAGIAVVVATVLAANRTKAETRRGLLLGGASGILFGLVAGLIKLVIVSAAQGFLHIFGHWSIYAMCVVGAGAIVLNQRAYQVTRLSVSMPVLNILEVLVAIAFGLTVFGERLSSPPVSMAAELVGFAVMAVGVWKLAAAADQAQRSGSREQAESVTADAA
jgi:drug/metabolite transporter (DMT)-like permease